MSSVSRCERYSVPSTCAFFVGFETFEERVLRRKGNGTERRETWTSPVLGSNKVNASKRQSVKVSVQLLSVTLCKVTRCTSVGQRQRLSPGFSISYRNGALTAYTGGRVASPQSPRQPDQLCVWLDGTVVPKVFPARPSLFSERESSRNDLSVPSFEGNGQRRAEPLLFYLPFTPGVSRKLHLKKKFLFFKNCTVKSEGFVHCSWWCTFAEVCAAARASGLNKVVKRVQKGFCFLNEPRSFRRQFFLIYEGWFQAIN